MHDDGRQAFRRRVEHDTGRRRPLFASGTVTRASPNVDDGYAVFIDTQCAAAIDTPPEQPSECGLNTIEPLIGDPVDRYR